MPINIHGKEYFTVAERITAIHEKLKGDFSITTEVLSSDPTVVVKATVTIKGNTFTGISAANPLKAIEKASPYEVAETSAVGRALGFAGFGVDESIASADEIVKATTTQPTVAPTQTQPEKATLRQAEFITKASNGKVSFGEASTWSKTRASIWIGDYKKRVEGELTPKVIKTAQDAQKVVDELEGLDLGPMDFDK